MSHALQADSYYAERHPVGAKVLDWSRAQAAIYIGGMMNRKGPGMPEGIPGHWQFYFTVDDIEAAQKRVIEAGGKVVLPPTDVPGGSRILQATDDQNGHFALMQGPKS